MSQMDDADMTSEDEDEEEVEGEGETEGDDLEDEMTDVWFHWFLAPPEPLHLSVCGPIPCDPETLHRA